MIRRARMRAASLPRDVGKRREAVLSLADAQAALADDNTAADLWIETWVQLL